MNIVLEQIKNIEWDVIYFGYHDKQSKKNDNGKLRVVPYNTKDNIGGCRDCGGWRP